MNKQELQAEITRLDMSLGNSSGTWEIIAEINVLKSKIAVIDAEAAGTTPHIYHLLIVAGVPLDHHESDLQALVTPESMAIVKTYEFKQNVRTFRSQTDGQLWYEIPFAYLPFWEMKAQ